MVKGFSYLCLGFALISLMSLDGRKDIKSVQSAWSISHSEFQAKVLPLYTGITNELKINTNTILVVTRHLHCWEN